MVPQVGRPERGSFYFILGGGAQVDQVIEDICEGGLRWMVYFQPARHFGVKPPTLKRRLTKQN